MYNVSKNTNDKFNKIKKTQKGTIPFIHKKGYLNTIGTIALKMKKSLIKTSKNIKDLKLFITKGFHYPINVSWNITPIYTTCKRQGVRMGKGKSKINNICNKYSKSFNILNILYKKPNKILKSKISKLLYTNVLKNNIKYLNIKNNLKKLNLVYPYLEVYESSK